MIYVWLFPINLDHEVNIDFNICFLFDAEHSKKPVPSNHFQSVEFTTGRGGGEEGEEGSDGLVTPGIQLESISKMGIQ